MLAITTAPSLYVLPLLVAAFLNVKIPCSTASTGTGDTLGIAHAAVQRGCVARYTMTCLKLDALSVLSRMAVPASYDLLPGVTIHRQQDAASGAVVDLPVDLVRSLATDSRADRRLDEYLMTRFGNFLDSHTVQVHLLDLQPVASLRRAFGDSDSTGTLRSFFLLLFCP